MTFVPQHVFSVGIKGLCKSGALVSCCFMGYDHDSIQRNQSYVFWALEKSIKKVSIIKPENGSYSIHVVGAWRIELDHDLEEKTYEGVEQEQLESKGSKPKTLRSARKLGHSKKPEDGVRVKEPVENKRVDVRKHQEPQQPQQYKQREPREPREQREVKPSLKLQLQLSGSLARRLKHKAQAEGVSVEEFCTELLAEGLVLRAWEIMEGKSAMKSSSAAPQHQGGQRHSKGYRQSNFKRHQSQGNWNQNGGNWHDGNTHPSNHSARDPLDDQATFFEYVRNQEKNQR